MLKTARGPATHASNQNNSGLHSLRSVRAIVDTHYLSRDPALAESAIRKLEWGTKTSN